MLMWYANSKLSVFLDVSVTICHCLYPISRRDCHNNVAVETAIGRGLVPGSGLFNFNILFQLP